MSLSFDRSALSRLNREIADLRIKEAAEAKKVADAQKGMNRALDSARRSNSTSIASSHLNTADRESRKIQSALEAQSRLSKQAADKTQDAARLQERIAREEENQRRKSEAAADTLRKADLERQKRAEQAAATVSQEMRKRIEDLEALLVQQLEERAAATPTFNLVKPAGESETYDVFISHASEDKAGFADALAEKARSAGLRVWYDRFALEWGDSLRQKIDTGLASSYFGVAVLSPSFFAKKWTQYELDALVGKGMSGTGRLLPIWHQISKDEVAGHSPALAERLALSTAFMTTDEIVEELLKLRDKYRANAGPQDTQSAIGHPDEPSTPNANGPPTA